MIILNLFHAYDLSFIGNMGGHTSDKLQIVHPLFLGLAFIILIANLKLPFFQYEKNLLIEKEWITKKSEGIPGSSCRNTI